METISLSLLNIELIKMVLLAIGAFTLSMALTPVYTFVAYRYRFWKRQRTTSTTGEQLKVFLKLHEKDLVAMPIKVVNKSRAVRITVTHR